VRSDAGVALILVLLAILVLTTLTAAMVFSARSEALASYNYRIGTQAEYVALAGVQRALNFFNSNRYAPLPPANAATYYGVSTYVTRPVDMYFANTSPVTCTASCSSSGPVRLGNSASSSAYPPSSATAGVNVVNNWISATNNKLISDSLGGSGNYSVTASLLEYHSVNNAFFGVPATGCPDASAALGICRQPYEVWQVTSTGTWNSNLGAGAALPTVQMVATISPMYLPYFGNALYGLCSVTISGNVCTDSYNSARGAYGMAASSCATSTSGTSNAQAAGAGIGSNGGVTINGSSNTIGGNVTYANQNPDSTCNTGFQGTATGVAGAVLPGPATPTPPTPNMAVWGYPTNTPLIQPPSAPGGGDRVANIYTRQTTPPPLPPGVASGACPPGFTAYLEKYKHTFSGGTHSYSNYSCVGLSGSGTAVDPYRLGDVTANASSPGTINLLGPSGPASNPIYVAANNITIGTNGVLNTSYAAPPTPSSGGAGAYSPNPPPPTNATATPFVIHVRHAVDLGGTATLNYNPATPGIPSPSYLMMNVLGTGAALTLSGQAQLGATLNVPNGTASLGGSGSSGAMFGSILAKNIEDRGNYPVHYDLSARSLSGQLFTAQVVSVTRPKF
jgi:Tfp pilus assembly protein PilX